MRISALIPAYLSLLRISLSQYFVYRLNFLLWRVRVVLNLLLIYFLWSAVYLTNRQVLGYDRHTMLTYVLMMSFFSDIVFSSKVHEVGAEILQGDIMNHLLRPFSYAGYLITKEVADKMVNATCSFIEVSIIVILLHPGLAQPHSGSAVVLALVQLALGIGLSFIFSVSNSLIAFWTAEIWAPRFIYVILVFMLAGNYFPLDILPPRVYQILLFTPFPYFLFIPIQTYLRGVDAAYPMQIAIALCWIVISAWYVRVVWRRGMKTYHFGGR